MKDVGKTLLNATSVEVSPVCSVWGVHQLCTTNTLRGKRRQCLWFLQPADSLKQDACLPSSRPVSASKPSRGRVSLLSSRRRYRQVHGKEIERVSEMTHLSEKSDRCFLTSFSVFSVYERRDYKESLWENIVKKSVWICIYNIWFPT